jgi:hypothetical protein
VTEPLRLPPTPRLLEALTAANGGEAPVFVPGEVPPGRVAVRVSPAGPGLEATVFVPHPGEHLAAVLGSLWFCDVRPEDLERQFGVVLPISAG